MEGFDARSGKATRQMVNLDSHSRKMRFAKMYCAVAIASLIAFGTANLISGNIFGFCLEYGVGFFLIFALLLLRHSGNLDRAQSHILFSLSIVLSYLLISGGVGRTGIFWWFTFPVASFFFCGRKRGWIWIGVLLTEAVAIMFFNNILPLGVPYSFIELRQFVVTFFVLSFVLQHYEVTRNDYEVAIRKNMKELEIAGKNIKTLKGLIPICASCKKIRDDKGYWQQVETYVSKHTEADFSHGYCDECAEKFLNQP